MSGLWSVLTRKLWDWYKTHDGDANAHHTKYTNAEAIAALNEEGEYYRNSDVCMNNNPFGGRRLYINSMNNAIFRADKRFTITANYHNKSDDSIYDAIPDVKILFDGDYDNKIYIPAGKYAKIHINLGGNWPGYPYGTYYISNYYNYFPDATTTNQDSVSVYCNHAPHGIGWHTYNFSDYLRQWGALITHRYVKIYRISEIEFKIYADDSNTRRVTHIDWNLDRPTTNPMPVVDKFKANTIYDKLTMDTDMFRLKVAKTPSSATDTGNQGDICWDASYVYVCTATNTWKRASLSTW